MSKKTLPMFAAAFAAALLLLCRTALSDTPVAPLAGRWVSEQSEQVPGAGGDVNYLVREFEFDRDRWSIDFTIYDDAARTKPLLHGRNAGTYALSGPLSQGPQRAEFKFLERELRPATAGMRQALSAAQCGTAPWRAGEAQSVFDHGCAPFRVFARRDCEAEYDLLALRAGKLFLGARPADGSLCSAERRPTRLGLPLVAASPRLP